MARARKPTCPVCGSHDIIFPGRISFVWKGGRWKPDLKSSETADGDYLNCECGVQLECLDIDAPFELRVVSSPEQNDRLFGSTR